MSEEKSLDILGTKPLARAVDRVTKGSVDGAGAFLSRICLPAAEEFGLLLKDRVSEWRRLNAVKIAQKAEKIGTKFNSNDNQAHPRLVMKAIEDGSWSDSDDIQDMWAGLLSSSCVGRGESEDNLIFMDILSQLTITQARIMNWTCENSVKYVSAGGYLLALPSEVHRDEICEISNCSDIQILDFQLDHLREIGLLALGSGFQPDSEDATLHASAMALHFHVRCQGYVGSPLEFLAPLPTEQDLEAQGLLPLTSTLFRIIPKPSQASDSDT